jgi:hypothetical protein
MLNYLEQKNFFWRVYDAHSLGQAEIALYFHLLEICDKCNWMNPFKRQNTKICSHLGMSKKTLERTRNKLQQVGLIKISGTGKGSTNISYELEKEREKVIKYSSKDSSNGPTSYPSDGSINKEEKRDYKKVVVTYAEAAAFFLETKNFRTLSEKYFGGAREPTEEHFKVFYDDKVDLGEFDNKTKPDLVKHFSYWLPDYLRAREREKLRSERTGSTEAGRGAESKTAAAVRRHEQSLRKLRQNGTEN